MREQNHMLLHFETIRFLSQPRYFYRMSKKIPKDQLFGKQRLFYWQRRITFLRDNISTHALMPIDCGNHKVGYSGRFLTLKMDKTGQMDHS